MMNCSLDSSIFKQLWIIIEIGMTSKINMVELTGNELLLYYSFLNSTYKLLITLERIEEDRNKAPKQMFTLEFRN